MFSTPLSTVSTNTKTQPPSKIHTFPSFVSLDNHGGVIVDYWKMARSKIENGQEVKYFESIGDCQNQSWVVPGPSIPHLLTGGRGQNLQDKMFHTLRYISTSMFYLAAVQCVRGEDLVDCVMIGAAGFTLPSLPCIALVWLYRFPISACLFVALYLCKALLFCWSRLVCLCMVWCGMLLCGLV